MASKKPGKAMPVDSETPSYYIRGTDPRSNEQVTYECKGFAMAHAKAAELRMGGFKDVVLSIASVNDNETGDRNPV
jgi:hypothetical protein